MSEIHSENMSAEELLRKEKRILIRPAGSSMLPTIRPGRDAVIVEEAAFSDIRRNDIVLYRDDTGMLVLHRVLRTDRNSFSTVGDNQTAVSEDLKPECLLGIVRVIIRDGKQISVASFPGKLITGFWLLARPVRPLFWTVGSGIKHMFSK